MTNLRRVGNDSGTKPVSQNKWTRVTRRAAAGITAVATAVLAGAGMLAGAGPAAAQPTVLYATVTAAGSGDCSDAADACTLSTALGEAAAGGVIELVTPGGDSAVSRYVGNWAVSTPGTSAGQAVTIEEAPGLAGEPVLEGDGPPPPRPGQPRTECRWPPTPPR
jgi:hypothetical protein